MERKEGVIALFDIDGTLTPPRKAATPEVLDFLQKLRKENVRHWQNLTVEQDFANVQHSKVVTVGIVGGSDLVKIIDQLGKSALMDYDYVFTENGLVAYKDGKLIGNQSVKTHLGEAKLKEFINFALLYMAHLDIPVKRGTFIEFRVGMINLCPVGRNCSAEEREEFIKYDEEHNVRRTFAEVLRTRFSDYCLTFSIGGQIGIDVFPRGWDKTFCLHFLETSFSEIHFFGDKTNLGGNDYEIFESKKTIGHTGYEDTIKHCSSIFLSNTPPAPQEEQQSPHVHQHVS